MHLSHLNLEVEAHDPLRSHNSNKNKGKTNINYVLMDTYLFSLAFDKLICIDQVMVSYVITMKIANFYFKRLRFATVQISFDF
jgi:hypothetical protein